MILTLAQQAGTAIEGAPLAVAGFVGLAALTWKFVDWLRLLMNFRDHRSGIITQFLAWVGACLAVYLYGESQFGDTVNISGISLDHMDSATKLLVGLAIGSTASVAVDLKQALDGKDDATKPALLDGPAPKP